MIFPASMKFDLGRIVITPAALETVSADEICHAIDRHVCGDWGDLDAADRAENKLALRTGSRLLSVYHTANSTKFYVLTEACHTTILLPEDF